MAWDEAWTWLLLELMLQNRNRCKIDQRFACRRPVMPLPVTLGGGTPPQAGAFRAVTADRAFDVYSTIGDLRRPEVMGSAKEAYVGGAAVATASTWMDVIVFQPGAGLALYSLITAEAAA